MKILNFPSYAKLNLHLRIVGREKNHYHLLQMLSIKISLHDQIQISIGKNSGSVAIKMNPLPSIPLEKNLVYKAINAYWKGLPPELMVHITKNIPMQAGLGGGSSNAASTLLALNNLYGKYSFQELSEIGFQLGCDIPFFLREGEGMISGMGEKVLDTCFLSTIYYFVVVKPAFSLSTNDVYQKWDQLAIPYSIAIELKKENALTFYNDLLYPAKELEPQLAVVLENIQTTSPLGFSMTGSGSACFGCYETLKEAKNAMSVLSGKFPFVCIATNLTHV